MELAVRAGSSKEWTLEQRPECTRLITAFVIILRPKDKPCLPLLRVQQPGRRQGRAGLERDSQGQLASQQLEQMTQAPNSSLSLIWAPRSVGREGWAPVAIPSTKCSLPQGEAKGLHLDMRYTAWV